MPTTLYDADGNIIGYRRSDGELVPIAPSNVGQFTIGWNEVTGRKEIVGTVVWDGAAPATATHGRGELLGDYAGLRLIWRRLGITGPVFKTAHYPTLMDVEDEQPEGKLVVTPAVEVVH